MHTRYRSRLGQINWLQSRTQFQCCYKFSRCASRAASPTIGDVKALSKLARQLKSQPVKLQFWPLTGPLRNNWISWCLQPKQWRWVFTERHDSVFTRITRAFLEGWNVKWKSNWQRKSKDSENTTLNNRDRTVFIHEMFWFMPWIVDGLVRFEEIHMRTDAKNLVTTARTIHLLEQKETIHIISMLRKEACSWSIHDLAHISIQNCFADCLTKSSAKADNLITAVKTGRSLEVDFRRNFRTHMENKASLVLHGAERSCT